MKKVLLTLVCACALTLGSVFAAQAETSGVYIAPKFLGMWQNADSNLEYGERVGGLGYTIEGSKFNSQFTMGGALAVGYDFYPQNKLPFRAELEFAMRGTNEFNADGNVSGNLAPLINSAEGTFKFNASTLMANLFYDFHNDSDFTPYVTAGAGLAFISTKAELTADTPFGKASTDGSKSFTNFAWNVGAGVAYSINENFAVDLGYRYVNMGNVSDSYSDNNLSYDMDANLSSHEIALGIRYTF